MADLHFSTRPSSETARDAEGALRGAIVERETLSAETRASMFGIFSRYFEAGRDAFERDLDDKEWVILLRDAVSDEVEGFSTLATIELDRGGDACTVLFSGDTVVNRRYWGSIELPRLWGLHVFGIADALAPRPVYWFLISSGFRTYRYLPLYFREFHPSPSRPAPAEAKELLDHVATMRFGGRYDSASGVIRLADRTPLRGDLANPGARATRDENVRFFVTANPRHADGDELACIVRLERENLTRAGRRMIGMA